MMPAMHTPHTAPPPPHRSPPQALATLAKVACNVADCGNSVEKYRAVKVENPKFRAAVWDVPGAAQVGWGGRPQGSRAGVSNESGRQAACAPAVVCLPHSRCQYEQPVFRAAVRHIPGPAAPSTRATACPHLPPTGKSCALPVVRLG